MHFAAAITTPSKGGTNMPASHKGAYLMWKHEDSTKDPRPVIGWLVMVFGKQYSIRADGKRFRKDILGPDGKMVRIQLTVSKNHGKKSRKTGMISIAAIGRRMNNASIKGYFMTRLVKITCFQNGKRVPAGDFYFAGHQSGAYLHDESEYVGQFLN